MFPRIDVEFKGKKILDDLANMNEGLLADITEESMRLGDEFTFEITDYPPETDGNQPPTPYYQRGTGYIVGSGYVSHPSENFKENVTYRVVTTINEVLVKIKLLPSYSNWLVGTDDQAWFHARNGWNTIGQVLKGMNIPGDEKTNADVPLTNNMKRIASKAFDRLRRYS